MEAQLKRLEGREFCVVPIVMTTVGVWNEQYYTADALRQSVPYWNGRPVLVRHTDGAPLTPEVFNAQKIGILFNTSFDGLRLKAEAWLDPLRTVAVDWRVYNAVMQRQTMDVSIGSYYAYYDAPGTYNGQPYRERMLKLMPDHLAILPDEEGACSVANGAGLLRNGTADDAQQRWQPPPAQPALYPPYTPPVTEGPLPLPAMRF